jgi:hypothetical protein
MNILEKFLSLLVPLTALLLALCGGANSLVAEISSGGTGVWASKSTA